MSPKTATTIDLVYVTTSYIDRISQIHIFIFFITIYILCLILSIRREYRSAIVQPCNQLETSWEWCFLLFFFWFSHLAMSRNTNSGISHVFNLTCLTQTKTFIILYRECKNHLQNVRFLASDIKRLSASLSLIDDIHTTKRPRTFVFDYIYICINRPYNFELMVNLMFKLKQ